MLEGIFLEAGRNERVNEAQQVAIAHIEQLCKVALSLCGAEIDEIAPGIAEISVLILASRVPTRSSLEGSG
jgi:hypothetical protein